MDRRDAWPFDPGRALAAKKNLPICTKFSEGPIL
jgi:hypothetical protein